MQRLEKPPKRIVTKRQYLAKVGDKAGTSVFALILLFFCGVGLLTTLAFLLLLLFRGGQAEVGTFLFLALATALLGVGSVYLGYLGKRTLKEAMQIDTGKPLTRSNTGDLPAVESFVRASEPPVIPQQGVLLRPSIETQDTHEEQLLRPS